MKTVYQVFDVNMQYASNADYQFLQTQEIRSEADNKINAIAQEMKDEQKNMQTAFDSVCCRLGKTRNAF